MKPAQRRKKGKRIESELYEVLLGDSLDVQRCDASGAGKVDKGDFVLRFKGRKYLIECKGEKSLPIAGLEKRKADSDILIMRQNRGSWKVYLDLTTLELLLLNNR